MDNDVFVFTLMVVDMAVVPDDNIWLRALKKLGDNPLAPSITLM